MSTDAALHRPRFALPLLIGIALLGWGMAGAAFVQRDNALGRLAQAEAARASQLADSQQATAQLADLQQKLAAAQAEATDGQARLAEATQRLTAQGQDLAAQANERDTLRAQLAEAQAKLTATSPKPQPQTPARKSKP